MAAAGEKKTINVRLDCSKWLLWKYLTSSTDILQEVSIYIHDAFYF